MRFTGHLQQWNEQRGFGFIRPAEGGDDVFVHVSALPSPPPAPHELLSFEVALDARGRKKATQVRRLADTAAALAADRQRDSRRGAVPAPSLPRVPGPQRSAPRWLPRFAPALVVVAAVALAGWAGFGRDTHGAGEQPASLQGAAALPRATPVAYSCDGRTRCSQMRSCEEATFFLRNCPHTEMDGDHDGVPCEQQWCTSSWR